jgi:predicted NAD/FAD-dependent oxidoreductase
VIEELAERGVVGPFLKERAPTGEARWVGTPTMRSLPQAMSLGLDVRLETKVTKLRRVDRGWEVELEGRSRLDAARVVVAIPAPQARELLVASGLDVPEALARVEVAPCWALMVEVDAVAEAPWTLRDTSPFSWICRQDGDGPIWRWVAHADREFSERHLEDSQDEIVAQLTPSLLQRVGATRALSATAHRWRFARTTKPAGAPAIAAIEGSLVLAGDYCLGDRVEHAFTSGLAAAELLSAR